jgi:hypothetical protein
MDTPNPKELQCIIKELIDKELKEVGFAGKFLTPEQLAERWQVTLKTLETWRQQGKPPIYMKVQGSKKALIRYPLAIENGVIAVEAQWLRSSTTDRGGQHDRETYRQY